MVRSHHRQSLMMRFGDGSQWNLAAQNTKKISQKSGIPIFCGVSQEGPVKGQARAPAITLIMCFAMAGTLLAR